MRLHTELENDDMRVLRLSLMGGGWESVVNVCVCVCVRVCVCVQHHFQISLYVCMFNRGRCGEEKEESVD